MEVLAAHGITAKRASALVRSGGLLRLARGAYGLPGDTLQRDACLAFLAQQVPGLHVAGKTALAWRGVRHNLAFRETVVLWGDQPARLPHWLDGVVQVRYRVAHIFDEAMQRSASLYEALEERFPAESSYAVSLAYRVRFSMDMNAREAMHLIELRTTPQGHPAYRIVGQEMHRLIAEQAGHHAIASMMRFVDHSAEPELERLQAERRAESRRLGT
jgi:hypothetical protein